ncbi:cation:proton antiporter [Halocatena pleomorpha]|uniref:Cation:proton antiporter n=1 Tax=Halocatena pleomorpha TaxID=1785090 RepID=A0A3P3R8H8_9EURY|nr:cation:proton antiporter [Halocatena pleomorpha]RRJ29782.1 cation:proton antiporter [Halocatena pleomorpha]
MSETLLLEIGIALTGIAVAGAVANRLSLSVIPAYIAMGILIGPNEPSTIAGISLTLVDQREFIDVVAELGIVFLLFFLGVEFSISQLLNDRRRIATIGTVDFLVNFSLGIGLGIAFGYSLLETFFLAGIVYISSSAVISKSLIESGWVANAESGPILGTLVFEDILIAIYLALLTAVAGGGGTVVDAAVAIGGAFVFLGGLTLIAWYGSSVIEQVFDADSDELFLLRILGVTTLVAGFALTIGLSEAVAAFFVGTAFSETNHIERIETVVTPARDFFAAVFFFSIGLTTEITLLTDLVWLLLAAVLVTTVGKMVSGSLSGRIYRLDRRRSMRVGVGLVPRGEFSLVIATLAASVGTGALGGEIPVFTVGYVLVMSVVGTLLIQNADRVFEGITAVSRATRRTETG